MRGTTNRRTPWLLLLIGAVGAVAAVGLVSRQDRPKSDKQPPASTERQPLTALVVTYPLDGAIFPREIVSPQFRWTDPDPMASEWLVTVRFERSSEQFESLVHTPTFRPSPEQWELMKSHSVDGKAVVTVMGRSSQEGTTGTYSQGTVSFTTSKDPLTDSVFYREVVLPFSDAVRDPTRIRWRYGSLAKDSAPPVVLENLPVCGNCHSFSADGRMLGMDIDYGNDKGAYALTRVAKEMSLAGSDIITWSDYQRDPNTPTFGLLSQVSPDGRFVVSTVKDRSVFVAQPELAFSQLFFPIQGILAVYNTATKTFSSLPGADNNAFVQSNPVWSPDGQTIVFARSLAYQLKNLHDKQKALLTPEECREFVDGKTLFKFDLYRVPFRGGKGGVAEPLAGASGNGLSNYFPRFSPDGRWIVFCKSNSFMLLQPDSKLYIMPATGGEPRLMRCNTATMNSWHSWSSNGRWLIFSSKANSPYTQLFVTHIDENGNDAPAVLLENFTSKDRAANIPEFVAATPDAISHISPRYIDDVSLWRSAMALMEAGDFRTAAERFREALKVNPRNVKAHIGLGNAMEQANRYDEAMLHYQEAIRLEPTSAIGRVNAGNIFLKRGERAQAMGEYEAALKTEPDNMYAHLNLGQCHLAAGKYPEALVHLKEVHRQDPNNALLCYFLGKVQERLGARAEAMRLYQEALRLRPDYREAKEGLAALESAR